MADIIFTDWNNYTDRNGSAQTLDWDNLPAFIDVGVGITALVQAINERVEVVVDDEELLLPLKSFYSLEDVYLIDEKLNALCINYLNHSLEYVGNTVLTTSFRYGTINNVLTKLEQDKIPAEAFGVISREWLKQRYDIINEMLWVDLVRRGALSSVMPHIPIAKTVYYNSKSILQYPAISIEADFNALPFTKTVQYEKGDTALLDVNYLRHYWGATGIQRIVREIPGYDFSNILSNKKCTKHTFGWFERNPTYNPQYQDNDFSNIYLTRGYGPQILTPENANLDFDNDYLNYNNNTCTISNGYFVRWPYVIFKFNVTGGFAFQPNFSTATFDLTVTP